MSHILLSLSFLNLEKENKTRFMKLLLGLNAILQIFKNLQTYLTLPGLQ